MTDSLSKTDVEQLATDRSPEIRAQAARKIAGEFQRGGLNPRERRLAEDIFRVLVRDVEMQVRQALAEQLKESRLLPHDIALALARDVHSVSLPMLECSEVLTDEDLVEIVRSQDGPKQVAVARRRRVSPPVAGALVDSDNSDAVAELIANEGAELDESLLHKVLDNYGERAGIQERMTGRYALPPTVADRLVTAVSERLRSHLMSQQELPEDAVSDLVQFSRERAILGIVWGAGSADLERFMRRLHTRGRLTPTLLLRAICMGDRLFFETGMAVRANVPIRNAAALIYEGGRRGFEGLYEKAKMPPDLLRAFIIAVNVTRETALDGLDDHDRERYRQRVIERILTQFESLGADNLDYLLAKLGHRAGPSAAVAP
ncbi:MAG TPA: DUF2336 domain-containing protein [Alphaproteobacteria bacterium]|nr:DUF2336 domain-containing protein [Alphaproteobacteria bacterium]